MILTYTSTVTMAVEVPDSVDLYDEHGSLNGLPEIKSVVTQLGACPEVNMAAYVNSLNGAPNEAGTKALTSILVHGLMGNIRQAHEQGIMDDAKHLKEAIRQLEDLFVMNGVTTKFGKPDAE